MVQLHELGHIKTAETVMCANEFLGQHAEKYQQQTPLKFPDSSTILAAEILCVHLSARLSEQSTLESGAAALGNVPSSRCVTVS